MTVDDIKAQLMRMLQKSERSAESRWKTADYWLRKYSIRGRSSTNVDQLRSNRQRLVADLDVRTYRAK